VALFPNPFRPARVDYPDPFLPFLSVPDPNGTRITQTVITEQLVTFMIGGGQRISGNMTPEEK
jgi:hypothetical protein